MHPVMDLPLEPFIVMPESGSEHLPYRSISGPVNYHTQFVPVIPERPVCLNPLQIEMERIQRDKEQAFKIHNHRVCPRCLLKKIF